MKLLIFLGSCFLQWPSLNKRAQTQSHKSQFAFFFNFYFKLWPLNKSTKNFHDGVQGLYSSRPERNDAQAALEKSLSYYNSAIAKF